MNQTNQATNTKAAKQPKRYWLTWVAMRFLRVATYLPRRVQAMLGRTIGRISYAIMKRRRNIATRNVQVCFPEMTDNEHRQIVKRCFVSLGMGIFESALAWWGSASRIAKIPVRYEGITHLEAAQQSGRPIILASLHMSSIELVGRISTRQLSYASIYRKQKNPIVDALLAKARARDYAAIIDRNDARGILKQLKSHCPIWLAVDQDYGRARSQFVLHFGIQTAFIESPVKLATMTNALILPTFYYRDDKTNGYTITYHEAIDIRESDSLAVLSDLSQQIEHAIRAHPEQYYWVHRRFKTRPVGEPSLYTQSS